jgi:hypothetical protein
VVYLFRRKYFNRVTGDILTDRIICVTLRRGRDRMVDGFKVFGSPGINLYPHE